MAKEMKRKAQLRRALNTVLIALSTVAPIAQSSVAAPEAPTAQSKGAVNPCAPSNPCAPKKKPKKAANAPASAPAPAVAKPTAPAKGEPQK